MNTRIRCPDYLFPLLLICAASPARAQTTAQPATYPPVADVDSSAYRAAGGWSALRIAKWSLAAASAGTSIYGFLNNQRADDRYERLEEMCLADPARCTDLLPDGSYADAELEAEYQAVRDIDARARTALIAGQVGVAASVLLFILDLRNNEAPENIPYEPRAFDIAPARDGGLSLRVQIRSR